VRQGPLLTHVLNDAGRLAELAVPVDGQGTGVASAVIRREGVGAFLVEGDMARAGTFRRLLVEQRQIARLRIDGEGIDSPAGLLSFLREVVDLADGIEELAG